eukprot:3935990-Rhodomonas_salina.1
MHYSAAQYRLYQRVSVTLKHVIRYVTRYLGNFCLRVRLAFLTSLTWQQHCEINCKKTRSRCRLPSDVAQKRGICVVFGFLSP